MAVPGVGMPAVEGAVDVAAVAELAELAPA
jgi:hypothetical protein